MNKKTKIAYGLVISAMVIMALVFTVSPQHSSNVANGSSSKYVRELSIAPSGNYTNTTFTEDNLPVGIVFKVRYDNITKNTTNRTLVFSTPAGNYSFFAYNSVGPNGLYVPTPQNGILAAGSNQTIQFHKLCLTIC